MTTRGPDLHRRSTAVQTVHLLLAAAAAIVIAVASQGLPSAPSDCGDGTFCDAG